jgi:hypothetical protein
MAKIQVKHIDDAPWLPSDAEAAAEAGAATGDGGSDGFSAYRMLHPGSAAELQLFQVRIPPDTVVPSHAHVEDEIIYVTGGELHLGPRVLTAGCSVFIAGGSLYTFRSGPNGLEFLNFRAHEDRSFIPQEEVARTKRAERGAQPA